jgi:hypothetical protein
VGRNLRVLVHFKAFAELLAPCGKSLKKNARGKTATKRYNTTYSVPGTVVEHNENEGVTTRTLPRSRRTGHKTVEQYDMLQLPCSSSFLAYGVCPSRYVAILVLSAIT